MSQTITEISEKYVTSILKENLSKNHIFHDYEHTLAVRDAAVEIGEKEDISPEEQEILELSALFHDVGYTRVYDGHEEESKKIAKAFLRQEGYNRESLRQVLECIGATRYGYQPQNKLEQIICDADLSNLGKPDYLTTQANLRTEWEIFRNEKYSDKKWYKLNRQFFKQHQFYTQAARDLYGTQKEENLALLKSNYKKKKKKKKNNSVKAPLASSKSVQVMFKTALRNHIDLTNLADNKANMMLSINAIIITITLPLLSGVLRENMFLIVPSTVLLLTCITSVIFATLATRPINMNGITPLDKVKEGKTNLFFFGNFYKMDISDYKIGMKEVINNEGIIEDSAISDLYYLGAALGIKYKLLRTCYTIFMIGMILTLIAFGIAKFMIDGGFS